MQSFTRRRFLEASCLAAGSWMLTPRSLSAAVAPGVETVAAPLIAAEESTSQPDIWAMEVRFKPVRMVYAEMTDAKTGKSGKELVWYLAYRAVMRQSSRPPASSEGQEGPHVFVPELTFVTEDQGKTQIYPDRILPQGQAAINKRERHKYKNSVEIVGPLPPVTPDNARAIKSLDGVATWTGIDPDTDFFAIYFTGFSNGYKIVPGPDGKEGVLRRTLVQKFWRPSDRFDQSEDEIRLKGEPSWIYR
jgi:hypothetical protein